MNKNKQQTKIFFEMGQDTDSKMIHSELNGSGEDLLEMMTVVFLNDLRSKNGDFSIIVGEALRLSLELYKKEGSMSSLKSLKIPDGIN